MESDPVSVLDIFGNAKVLITGNTGFKGSWLTLWLSRLGAKVTGYSLPPPTNPSLFQALKLDEKCDQHEGDVRDFYHLWQVIDRVRPTIIFHLAAQSLVRASYENPLETIQTNTMGCANLLEAIRRTGISTAVVMVTSDKCYDNRGLMSGYRETDPLGGFDPYSGSKGAAEIIINSMRNSFFVSRGQNGPRVNVASARAGNVIGGGDWAKDRIVPDCIRDLVRTGTIKVRNPGHTRPWQHVIEPLFGYLTLGAMLYTANLDNVGLYASSFNFGPTVTSNRPVKELVEHIIEAWGSGSWKSESPEVTHHEASLLNLNSDKAYHLLGWYPRLSFHESVQRTIDWYKEYFSEKMDMASYTSWQIEEYVKPISFTRDVLVDTNRNLIQNY